MSNAKPALAGPVAIVAGAARDIGRGVAPAPARFRGTAMAVDGDATTGLH